MFIAVDRDCSRVEKNIITAKIEVFAGAQT